MDPNLIYIIIGVSALIVGIIAGKFIFAKNTRKQVEKAEIQAQAIVKEAEIRAETIRKEKELEAKEKFVQMKANHDKEVLERNKKMNEAENRVRQKEQSINQKEGNLDKQIKENEAIKENLNRQIELVNIKRTELEKHQEEKPNRKRIKKLVKLLFKPFNAPLLSKRLKMQSLFLILKQMRLKGRSLAEKDVTFVPLRLLRVLI